jgi:transcriptional regulator with XRE-family HTH domain
MSGRNVSAATAWYIGEVVEAWLAADKKRTQVQLAEALGVSTAQVSTIRSGDRGIGYKTAVGVAKWLKLKGGLDELEADAAKAYKARGPVATTEPDDAYPARAPLLRALRESTDPFAHEVLDELLSATSFAGAEKLTLVEWIGEASDAAKKVERRRRANPEPEAQDPRAVALLARQTRVREDAGVVKKDAPAHPEKKRKRPPE